MRQNGAQFMPPVNWAGSQIHRQRQKPRCAWFHFRLGNRTSRTPKHKSYRLRMSLSLRRSWSKGTSSIECFQANAEKFHGLLEGNASKCRLQNHFAGMATRFAPSTRVTAQPAPLRQAANQFLILAAWWDWRGAGVCPPHLAFAPLRFGVAGPPSAFSTEHPNSSFTW